MATKHNAERARPAPAYHSVHEDPRIPLYRAHALLCSLAVVALVCHRAAALAAAPTLLAASLLSCLLAADLVLAFLWACGQAFRWRPVRRAERLGLLPARAEWPALDVFVCTADPRKEPPAAVASTALSLMALDYPPERLSVYVSDDGGCDVTLLAFTEAARFAAQWLPFCRENGIRERSPEAFFASGRAIAGESYEKLKILYENMKDKMENGMRKGCVTSDLLNSSDEFERFKKWERFARNDHPGQISQLCRILLFPEREDNVLLDSSKDKDVEGNSLPNLIYISREKRPSSPHHFKAGALNVLTRVSSVLTNAPVMLTVDCDMNCTDPEAPSRALCYFLDPLLAPELAYVQFPQHFQGLNKTDIYASAIKYIFEINPRGMDGLRGPIYFGTNTFLSRRALQGPTAFPHERRDQTGVEMAIAKALEVASVDFEHGTEWGSTVGFRYGSLVEDYYTAYRLHCEGWKSVFCNPPMPAFVGEAPRSLHDALSQWKRWMVGLCEVAFSSHCPLAFGTRNASLPMGLCYSYTAFWSLWCLPVTTYALLPQLALVCRKHFFPKTSDPWFYLYVYLFLAAYVQDLADFCLADGLEMGSSNIGRWWNDQRMWMVRGVTSFLFATLQFLLNQAGIATQGFNVTSKIAGEEQNERYERGDFDFGNLDSPFFVSLGTAAMLSLFSFAVGVMRVAMGNSALDESLAELLLTGFIVVNCWPLYEAMFLRSDGGRMATKATALSLVLAVLLLSVGWRVLGSA